MSKSFFSFVMAVSLLLAAFSGIQPASSKTGVAVARQVAPAASQNPDNPAFVPGVVLVGLRENVSLATDAQGKVRTNSAGLDATLSSLGVRALKPLFSAGQAQKDASLGGIYRLQMDASADVKAAVKVLSESKDVSFAEPDYIALPASTRALTIDDPLYSQQWGLAKINIEGAWASTYGAPTVSIAVMDSGIDQTHIDLATQLWVNPGEIAGNGLDDDNNGYVDDVKGWNFVSGNNIVADDGSGHGTLVAGVAAAIAGNGQGIAGVCPQCSIMPVKVMSAAGTANYSDIAAGVLYAAAKGAKVINLSLGGYANSSTLRNAIDTAVSMGAVIVAGAGNDNLSTPFYPAAYDNVLAVAGSQSDDIKVGTSNYGSWVDVSAPGMDIYTTALGGDWVGNASGTSFAAPFAAGLAGLLRTQHPDWSANLIRAQIINTTDGIDNINPGYEGSLGSGRINAQKALTMAPTPQLSLASYTVNGVTGGTPAPGSSVNLVVKIQNSWGMVTGVTGTLSSSDPSVTVTSASASYNNIDAYAAATNAVPFKFSVSPSALYGQTLTLALTINAAGGVNVVLPLTITTESSTVLVGGYITADTTWTNDRVYEITSNVQVNQGVSLTIQPGTLVRFRAGKLLQVAGTLIADGQVGNPIVFTSAAPTTYGDWGPINFVATAVSATLDVDGNYVSGSIIRHARIEYGMGIGLLAALPYISDNTFTKNLPTYAGTWMGGCDYAVVHYNDPSSQMPTGTFAVRNSTFMDNQGAAIATAALGNKRYEATGNVIIDQAGPGLVNCGATTVGTLFARNRLTRTHGISLISSDALTIIEDNYVAYSTSAAYTAGFGVDIYSGSPIIRHNIFAYNGQGQTICISAPCAVINTFAGGGPEVTSNTFISNWLNVLIYANSGYMGGTGVYQNNNLAGNQVNYIVYRSQNSSQNADATSNYWGTTDTTAIDSMIYDTNDDFQPGQVFYQPILTAPDASAPAYLLDASVNPDPVGIQPATFTLTFSRPMDSSVNPVITFGVSTPYTTYAVPGNGSWLDDHTWSATYDITSLVARGTHTLNVSGAKDTAGMEIAADTRFSFVVDYAGSITDKTPPTQPLVAAGGNSSLTSLSASWSSSDPQSPITKYRYAIGTTPGGRDVVDWTYTTATSMKRTGLNLTAGVTYYVSAGARNQGGLWSATGVSTGVTNGIGTLTLASVASQDGWILESSETSSLGGTLNATSQTFNLGDDKTKKQYRAALSFNTGLLPDTAVITKVTLKFKKSSVTGAATFAMFGGLFVDVKKGPFALLALQTTDFQATLGTTGKTYGPFTTALPSTGWYTVNLPVTGTTSVLPYINKLTTLSGVTQFRLRFKLDDNNDAVANFISFYSGNAVTAANRPQLAIQYYVP